MNQPVNRFGASRRLRFFANLAFLTAALLAAVSARPVYAAGPDETREFKSMQAAYDALSAKDPGVKDLPGWEKIASRFVKFIRKYDDPVRTPKALFTLGRLYETTYRQRSFQSGLTKAVYFYEELSRAYPESELAGDALLRLGDLRREELKDEQGAQAAYRKASAAGRREEAEGRLNSALSAPAAAASPDKKTGEALSAAKKPAVPQAEKVEVEEGGKDIYASRKDIKRPIIVIDPGHGGKEEGAHGLDGMLEKNLVLSISQMLEKLLRERLRAQTVLTRREDADLSLADRTRIANEHGADLFVSIHANASEYKNVSGIETYYLDNTDDKSSLRLAQRENASAMQESGGDLGFMVSDLIQDAKTPDSVALAHYIQNALHKTLSRYYKDVKDLGVKKAPFYVLVGAHMPCVLVEVSFIDHPIEGKRLLSRRYQKLVATAIYEGIRTFFESR